MPVKTVSGTQKFPGSQAKPLLCPTSTSNSSNQAFTLPDTPGFSNEQLKTPIETGMFKATRVKERFLCSMPEWMS